MSTARHVAMERWFGPPEELERRLQDYARMVCEADPDDVQTVAAQIAREIAKPEAPAQILDLLQLMPTTFEGAVEREMERSIRRSARMILQMVPAMRLLGVPQNERETRLIAKAKDLAVCAIGVTATMAAVGAGLARVASGQFATLVQRTEEVVTLAWANVLGVLDERENPTMEPSDEPFTFEGA